MMMGDTDPPRSLRSHAPVILRGHGGAEGTGSSDQEQEVAIVSQPDKAADAANQKITANRPGAEDVSILFLSREKPAKQRAYSGQEWDAMKPALQKFYMDMCISLERVMQLMAQEWDFHPTMKMYKVQFKRWKWRKNRSKCGNVVATSASFARGPRRRSRKPTSSADMQHLRGPDIMQIQEFEVVATRTYVRAQFESYGWRSNPFTLSKTYPPGEKKTLDCYGIEIWLLYSMHHLKQGNITSAYRTLGNFFDAVNGVWRACHPKVSRGYMILLCEVYDLCIAAKDYDVALLREVIKFQARGASEYLRDKPGTSHPLPRLMVNLAETNTSEPAFIKHMLGLGALASAHSLEEQVGADHPTVLFAWQNLAWHWQLPIVASKNLPERFRASLDHAEALFGRTHPFAIGLLFDLTLMVCHGHADRAYERRLAEDLLHRTMVHVSAGPPRERDSIARPYAFGTTLVGLFMLEEDDQPTRCQSLFQAAIGWFSQGGPLSQIHAEIMQADLGMLKTAWTTGKKLRELKLSFMRPRWTDAEREGDW
ncbi:hypothetical protein BJ170DRAFT_134531 [Xylariales sp. AK1849]|nr:hypothetical protein BJ170DRAFT_134531 [Xylariales sp. AK1849]